MLIETDHLTYAYTPHGEPVIERLDHRFEPGSLTLITGPSGSGKSTLLYVLALMLKPSSGVIRWAGVDVQTLPDAERSRLRAQHVGFVFQDAVLDLAQTAIDNVLEAAWLAGMPRTEARTRAMELMHRFGVAERATHLPGQVSGGQAQRVALCRALVKRPAIVFADEPTGNLDTDSAEVVWTALSAAAAEGATVIVATHDRARADESAHRLELRS